MGRPAVKKSYKEAKAAEKGRLQAAAEAHRKKSLEESAKEHIGKIIDNTKVSDIAEIMAAIGLTPMVEQVIKNAPNIASAVHNIFLGELTWPLAFVFPLNMFLPVQQYKKPEESVFTWLISFSVAYIIVRHAGQLIGLLEKGLTSIVPLLLGVL